MYFIRILLLDPLYLYFHVTLTNYIYKIYIFYYCTRKSVQPQFQALLNFRKSNFTIIYQNLPDFVSHYLAV